MKSSQRSDDMINDDPRAHRVLLTSNGHGGFELNILPGYTTASVIRYYTSCGRWRIACAESRVG
jgi:hypothetical protein